MLVKYVCHLPGVPGTDLLHPTKSSAEREARNARAHGLEATVTEVLVRTPATRKLAVA